MGICNSSESTSVETAKLILQDGQLQEFSYPVKVSYVLQTHPACFICNSDEMDFDDFVSAINADEELQPGQLYFAMPLSSLKHPLQAEDMAALAVKASSALMKSGCCGKGVNSVKFSSSAERRSKQAMVVSGSGGSLGEKKRRTTGDRRRAFTCKLSVIPE